MCQIEGKEIRCRGIGITYLPIIHNLEATYLDVGGVCTEVVDSLYKTHLLGLPNVQIQSQFPSQLIINKKLKC